MEYVKACGAVVYTVINKEIFYVVVKNRKNVCGFPKGFVEHGEEEKETALREILEETSLNVTLNNDFRWVLEYYQPEYNRVKYVTYFLGKYENQKVKCQEEELNGCYVLNFEETKKLIKEDNTIALLIEANNIIEKIEKVRGN